MSQRRRIARDASLGRDVDVSGLAESDPLRALKPEVKEDKPAKAEKPEPKAEPKTKKRKASK